MTQHNIQTEELSSVPLATSESAGQEAQTKLQTVSASESTAVLPAMKPRFPAWPTSKPGPRVKTPPSGMLSTHPFRSEQVTEIGYNQATGEPGSDSIERSLPDEAETGSVSFDLKPKTGQEILGKRKQRL
ncbi:MAG: hypothetical protein NVSMB44_22320 [Ktedonobacteraceae bacterium]